MLFRRLRQSCISKVVLFWLIPALLLSLGLRICLHFPDADHSTPVHLESMLATAADHGASEPTADVDMPLSAVLKAFQTNLACALFVFVLVLSFALRTGPGVRPETLWFRPPRGCRLTPPLRAPPR